jgi:hypothetical protein
MDQAIERHVRERAAGKCEYCQMLEDRDRPAFEIEHILARKHGGKRVFGNLALACFTCNHRKGPNIAGIDPKTKKMVKLFNPRRHKWHRHFRWDGPLLVGLTPIGRATIAVLHQSPPSYSASRRTDRGRSISPFVKKA